MMTKRLYAEISKTEELSDGTVKVWGYASTPDVDSDGEIITPAAMKAALPEYLKFGAVREMHGAKAAGTAIEAEVQDDGRTWFGAHIVDSEAVKKVRARVYKGFSIGGKIVSRDKVDKSTITGIKLVEVSLVDRPANPEAVFTMFKVEGVDESEVQAPAVEKAEVEKVGVETAEVVVSAVKPGSKVADDHPEKVAIDRLAGLVKSGEMKATEILARVEAFEELAKAEALRETRQQEIEDQQALHKAELAEASKAAEEALAKLAAAEAEKDKLAKRVVELEAIPLPPRARLKVVGKAEDGNELDVQVPPVRRADGSIDEVATEIKKIHRSGGVKIWG
jgi:phage head maturation protease